MAGATRGKRLRLSAGRRLVIEMLHHAQRVPSIPVARTLSIAPLVTARASHPNAPSWTAIFMRAYGIVAERIPELRRALIPYPRPHLYEHPHSVAALVVEREVDGEPALLAAKFRGPEGMTLTTISAELRRLKQAPLHEIGCFRQLLRLAKLPGFLRRFVFWMSLYWSGAKRAKRFGTFMVSSYGNLGAEQVHPITPLTTLLTFGPIDEGGNVTVKIIYDHRVMDGRRIATALQELETVLHETILPELHGEARRAA